MLVYLLFTFKSNPVHSQLSMIMACIFQIAQTNGLPIKPPSMCRHPPCF